MAFTTGEIADRLEIQDTLVRYAHALDQRRRDLWESAFTPDAVLDFRPAGMDVEYNPAGAWALFTGDDRGRLASQHLLLNSFIELDGDVADVQSEYLFSRVYRAEEPDKAQHGTGGGMYVDELRRTEHGWRIARRTVHSKWFKQETIGWNDLGGLPGWNPAERSERD